MKPLCAHVAVINYFYAFALGMWVFKPPSRLPAVLVRLPCQLKASEGSTAPVLYLIKPGVICASLEV